MVRGQLNVHKNFYCDAWKTVVELAEMKGDEKLLVRVRECDLFALEAHLHPNCRKKYIIDYQNRKSIDSEAKLYQEKLEAAHDNAFGVVCEIITKEVMHEKKIDRLAKHIHTGFRGHIIS